MYCLEAIHAYKETSNKLMVYRDKFEIIIFHKYVKKTTDGATAKLQVQLKIILSYLKKFF